MKTKNNYIKYPRLGIGLIKVCDVCGKPLLKNQKLGRKRINDALCHEKCLYYKIGNRTVSRGDFLEHIIEKNKNRTYASFS